MKFYIYRYHGIRSVLLVILLISLHANAQPPDTSWVKTYGGPDSDGGRNVIQTSDQGYLIAGWTWSFGPGRNDIFLIKTNAQGDTLWTRAYGSPFSDSYASAIETSDTNYVVAYTRGLTTGNADIGLIKINSSGDTVWTKSFGSMTVDGCYDIEQTSDNGFVLAGWTYSGGGGSDVYVIKTDASGDTMWSRVYGGNEDEYGYAIEQTSDNGYIIAGYTNSYGTGSYDTYIIKTDMNGDTLWTDVLGGDADDFAYGVMQASDSNYIVVGATWSFGPGTPDNSNSFLVKYNISGDTIWTTNSGGNFNERSYSLCQTLNTDIIIAGYTDSYGAGGFDIYLLKIDNSSDTLWTTTYGGVDNDFAYSIIQNSDTGYTIAGSTLSYGAGDYDVILLRTDPDLGILDNKHIEKDQCMININPNPFTNKAYIKCPMIPGHAHISIYDITGRIVKRLDSYGDHIEWSGDDDQGNSLPNGVYILTYQHPNLYLARSITLIK